jgi:hypothetical protein
LVERQGSTEGSTGSGTPWHCVMLLRTYISAPKNGWADSSRS